MARLPFLRRHVRWFDDANAYIDGELRASVEAPFEAHLLGCARCRARVDELRQVRLLVASLPEVAAPRSFRLTPAMVAGPAPIAQAPTPRPRFALHTAQFAAGFAVVALLAVVTIDVTSSNSSSSDGRVSTAAGQLSESAPRATAAADSSSSKSAPVAGAAATSAAAVPPSGGVSGASNPGATPASPQPQPNNEQYSSTGGTAGGAPPQAAGVLAQDANQAPGAVSSTGNSDDGWHRPAEFALGALALAALAVASTLTLRNRRNRDA
jgi:anti-sigma factor RsiW